MNISTQNVRKYLEERDWFNAKPANIAKSISIESAELLENFQWSDPTLAELKKDNDSLEKVKKELADVLIYTLHLTELLGLDPERIIVDKLNHASKKYPVHMVKGPDGSKAYLKRKQEYRNKGIN